MKDFILWIAWVPLRNLALSVSNKNLIRLSRVIGYSAYLLLGKRRSILKEEYSQMFPEKSAAEIRKIILDFFILRSIIEIEETLCTKIDKENIDQIIKISNPEYLEESLSLGKGVILATFHFGPHLQIMPALGFRDFAVNQVAVKWKGERKKDINTPPPGYFAEKLFRARIKHSGNKFPTKIIPLEKNSSPRPLFRCLASNEILIIAIDGREVGNIINTPFFHHNSYRFAAGPANLALRTGAPIHPVFVIKNSNGVNELIIEKSIPINQTEAKQEAIVDCVKKTVNVLENYVTEYPCHYGNELFHEKMKMVANKIAPDRQVHASND